MAVETFLKLSMLDGNALHGQVEDHAMSNEQERDALGRELLEVSIEWKRILSPMVSMEVVQETLICARRETEQ